MHSGGGTRRRAFSLLLFVLTTPASERAALEEFLHYWKLSGTLLTVTGVSVHNTTVLPYCR